ncbi:unnamed protein product, partial [Iphiclides podalirius]
MNAGLRVDRLAQLADLQREGDVVERVQHLALLDASEYSRPSSWKLDSQLTIRRRNSASDTVLSYCRLHV